MAQSSTSNDCNPLAELKIALFYGMVRYRSVIPVRWLGMTRRLTSNASTEQWCRGNHINAVGKYHRIASIDKGVLGKMAIRREPVELSRAFLTKEVVNRTTFTLIFSKINQYLVALRLPGW